MSVFEDLHVDHVGLAVGDLTRARAWWTGHYGMRVYAGPPPGAEPADAQMICLGNAGIRLLLTEAGSDDHPAAVYTRRHGDGICDIALATPDAAAAYREALRRGAAAVSPPRLQDGVVTASMVGFGDVTHTFIQRLPSTDPRALPGLIPTAGSPAGTEEPTGLRTIDHFAACLEAGQLLPTVAYYEQVLDFRTVFTERIIVGRQAMNSIVVQSLSGTVTLTLLEPDPSRDPGQIDQFLKDHDGPGIQHIAFATDDITREVSGLGAAGTGNAPDAAGAHGDPHHDRRLSHHGTVRTKNSLRAPPRQPAPVRRAAARTGHRAAGRPPAAAASGAASSVDDAPGDLHDPVMPISSASRSKNLCHSRHISSALPRILASSSGPKPLVSEWPASSTWPGSWAMWMPTHSRSPTPVACSTANPILDTMSRSVTSVANTKPSADRCSAEAFS